MKPFIFISPTNVKTVLRDYVHDLNQEMNLPEIVDYFYAIIQLVSNPNDKRYNRFISLLNALHSKAEMSSIIDVNLRRLNIHFSDVEKVAISGSELSDYLNPIECAIWWNDALLEAAYSALAGDYEATVPDGPPSINRNELDELREVDY